MVLDGSDREVIAGCQRGEHDSFAALFDAYKDKVYSIALRYSGDPAAAMDLAQEVFLKLLSGIKNFRGESSFDTWLYRLVVNCCLDHHRRGRRVLPLLDDFLAVFESRRDTPLNRMMREELAGNVQRAIGTLPPEQRIVVVLRYTEELPYEEIAGILGCSPGTVASRLNRAHKTLARKLSRYSRSQHAAD